MTIFLGQVATRMWQDYDYDYYYYEKNKNKMLSPKNVAAKIVEMILNVKRFNKDIFYEFIKQIHYKFPKCYLFLDKAPQHYRSHKIRNYFEKLKDGLIPIYLLTASSEFMVLEECWNISKDELVLTYYKSFIEFRIRLRHYFRTKHFNLNVRNYLIRGMSEDLSWFTLQRKETRLKV